MSLKTAEWVGRGAFCFSIVGWQGGLASSLLVRCFAAGTLVATATSAQPIETLRVGDRVASIPEDISAWQVPPVVESGVQPLDPEEWRLYTYAVQTDDIGRVDVCLLQPATLTRNGLDVGQTIEVRLDENGLAGPATVLAIEPCPPDLTLVDGTILATFQRYVSGPVVELTVGEPNGTPETLTVTAEHPFATVERGWVAAGSLSVGEHLHTRTGAEIVVQSVHWKNENLPVFNLAIAHDHTYFAGQSSLLVHNAGSVTCGGGGSGASGAGLDWVTKISKGSRPHPAAYMSVAERKTHAAIFEGGAVRIGPSAPTGTIGRTETWVFPRSIVDDLVKQSGGDVSKLERLLGLDAGYLGTSPVRVDIPNPFRVRIPTGNEFGANSFWRAGGRTSGGILEAVIDPVPAGAYTTSPVF